MPIKNSFRVYLDKKALKELHNVLPRNWQILLQEKNYRLTVELLKRVNKFEYTYIWRSGTGNMDVELKMGPALSHLEALRQCRHTISDLKYADCHMNVFPPFIPNYTLPASVSYTCRRFVIIISYSTNSHCGVPLRTQLP